MNTFARDKFQFNIGDEIHVISDKAFRVTTENTFEAIGNVIIKFGSNSIYSEKAKIDFTSGEISVEGNVRYVSTQLTMYGTHLYYNTKTQTFRINNARVLSDNFVILGKELTKYKDDRITGKEAEYSTCKDCPESWSIYGKDIDVTLGEYVTIKHGFIKTKGVVLMYIPYLLFPIKKSRETGILFPKTSFNFADGVKFQLPFFWAISNSNDMTLTPSVWGNRGFGGELEYRHYFTNRDWFEFDTLFANDKVYEPFKEGFGPSGKTEFRHFSGYEHHFSKGLFFNHHINIDVTKDLDMFRDFDFFTYDQVSGSEVGAEGFLDFRTDTLSLSLDSHFKQNLLVSDAKDFDDQYVQILPKIYLSSTPYTLIDTDYFGLNSFALGLEADYTIFKQNKINESYGKIRNVHRANLAPYVNWNLGNLSGINLNSRLVFDYQNYYLPTTTQNTTYSKQALVHLATAEIEFEKIFGVSYRRLIPLNREEAFQRNSSIVYDPNFIGKLPLYNSSQSENKIEIQKNSYRHSQIFRLNHYLLSGISSNGNDDFHNQLKNDKGHFDNIDALREKEFETSEVDNQTTLPLRNTIELQWNNSLIEKRARVFDFNEDHRFLKQNFDYSKIAYFNISQGYNLDVISDDVLDKLTRLYATAGLSLDTFSLSGSEYYFYKNQKHVFKFSLANTTSYTGVNVSFIYDSVATPINKLIEVGGHLNLIDTTKLYAKYAYDLVSELETRSLYGVEYTPHNDCWKIDFNYSKDEIEDRFSFNFMIKFNDSNFSSLSGK